MITITKTELVKEVRDKIEFTIVVAIFFSSFLYMAMRAGGSNDSLSNSIGVTWGIAVAIHILNYLLVDLSGKNIERNWFKWIKGSLAFGIFVFVPAILIAAIYYKTAMPVFWSWVYMVSHSLTLAMPIFIGCLISAHLDWVEIKDTLRLVKKKKSRFSLKIENKNGNQ